MAAKTKIRGITIEIGGDTTGLQKALSSVNGQIKSTQAQLKDVNTLLKLDPTNTILITQKQELLKQAITETTDKIEKLEAAQKDVENAMAAGKIGQEEYMAFQREVEATRAALGRYEAELTGLDAEQERLAANTERLEKLFEATESDVDDYADVLGSKLVTAIKNGSASSDQLKMAIEKIGRSATGGKADIKQMTEALDAVDDGQAIQNLINELKEAETQAGDTSEELEDIGKTLTGGAILEAADQLSAVGDKIKEIGEKATDAFTEVQDTTAKASAYFGETGKAAEETAGVIQNVYGEGVGDSMDAVTDAVITVKKNLKDLDETTLTHLTEQAITLDELYGIDMNETLRGVNSLMEQYGLTAQQAMDYIVKGTQNGLDKTNELGDNLSEYSGKFAQAGYSAQEYFQLLQNGLDNGAYNLDKVNDAINEVTTRLVDGTISDSLSQIDEKTGEIIEGTGGWGKEVEKTFKKWQQGGATQKDVIDAIVADIQSTENQQDKLNKAALAFGTMAEDGNAKFIESLTSVGNTYDDVTGSAENMFDQTTTESQTFTASMRELEQSLVPLGEAMMKLANEIIPPIAAGLKQAGEYFGKMPEPVQNFVVILGVLIATFSALAPAIAAVALAVTSLEVPLLPIIAIIAGVAAAIAGIIAVVKNWASISEWLQKNWENLKEKGSEIWSSICSFFTETIPQAWDYLMGIFSNVGAWWSGIWDQVGSYFSGIWDRICAFWTEDIPNAWQSAVSWLEGIPAWWSGIWDQVGSYFSGIWDRICAFWTEDIPNAWQSAVSWLEGIPAWWSGIWDQVQEAFDSVWQTMLSNPILASVAETIQNLWQNCLATLSGIWSGIKEAASGAWELIKNAILGPVLLLMDLMTGNFEQLKSDAINIWKNLSESVRNIASGMGQLIVSAITGLVNNAIILATGLKDTVFSIGQEMVRLAKEAWENLKTSAINAAVNLKNSVLEALKNLKDSAIETATNLKDSVIQALQNLRDSALQNLKNLEKSAKECWDSIKNTAINLVLGMKDRVIDMFFAILTGVKNSMVNIKNAIVKGFNAAIEFITSLPSRAVEWGKDLVLGIARGIRNSIGAITNAVSNVAEKIRSFLHFSVPDEGPLTDYESWMPDFMQGLAKGINKSRSIVADAIAGVSKDMTIDANAMIEQSSAKQNGAILNIASMLAQYLPYLAKSLNVRWETGEVAARLARDMDRELGILAQEGGFL